MAFFCGEVPDSYGFIPGGGGEERLVGVEGGGGDQSEVSFEGGGIFVWVVELDLMVAGGGGEERGVSGGGDGGNFSLMDLLFLGVRLEDVPDLNGMVIVAGGEEGLVGVEGSFERWVLAEPGLEAGLVLPEFDGFIEGGGEEVVWVDIEGGDGGGVGLDLV